MIIHFLQMKKLRLKEITDIYPLSKSVPEAGQELRGHKNSGRSWGVALDGESPKAGRSLRHLAPACLYPWPDGPAHSHLSVFALAVLSAWNALPTPSLLPN